MGRLAVIVVNRREYDGTSMVCGEVADLKRHLDSGTRKISPVKLRGVVKNDAFYFTLVVNGVKVPNIMLDTGAVELTFNGLVAKALGLPNLGSVRVSGIGGVTRAYRSRCNFWIGRHNYRNVPCIVVPGFASTGLFGLRFFIDNHLKLELNPKSQIFLISPAVD